MDKPLFVIRYILNGTEYLQRGSHASQPKLYRKNDATRICRILNRRHASSPYTVHPVTLTVGEALPA